MKSILKIFIALLVIVALAAALLLFIRNQTDSSVVKYYKKRGYSISQPLTVAEVEAKSLQELQNAPRSCPKVPFGYANASWVKLKEHIQPGDEILFIRSPDHHNNRFEFHILVRQNKIIYRLEGVQCITINELGLSPSGWLRYFEINFENMVTEIKSWF
jgi:hypothetical protein